MKRILVYCLSLILCLTNLSGCGTNKVSDEQIVTDIKNSDFLQIGFNSDFVYDSPYEYISHEVTKRQTNPENKEDFIYCNISAQNQYFKTTFDVKLEYSFYDEGGWILENSTISNKKAVPISSAEKDLIIDYIFNECPAHIGYIFLDDKIMMDPPTLENGYPGLLDIEQGTDDYLPAKRTNYKFGNIQFDEENYYTILPTEYSLGNLVNADGIFRVFFDYEKGWSFLNLYYGETYDLGQPIYNITPIYEINNINYDYSDALGKFGSERFYYNIKSINTDTSRIEIIECTKNKQKTHTYPIDLFKAEFSPNGLDHIFYDEKNDSWIEQSFYGGKSTYPRKD